MFLTYTGSGSGRQNSYCRRIPAYWVGDRQNSEANVSESFKHFPLGRAYREIRPRGCSVINATVGLTAKGADVVKHLQWGIFVRVAPVDAE